MIPNSERGSILLHDKWSGFNQIMALPEVQSHLQIEVLPAKTTPLIQTLDRNFNRQFKHFLRRFSDKVQARKSFPLSSSEHCKDNLTYP